MTAGCGCQFDAAGRPFVDRCVCHPPRVPDAIPNTRLLLRVESLDAKGDPMGDPIWLRGVAQLNPDDGGHVSLQWVADDDGRLYELSRDELAP